MKKTIKTSLQLTAAALLMGSGAVAQAKFNPAEPVMTELKPGVYQYFQFFYNSLVVVTDDGVIVTDPSGEVRAKAMREAIRSITDQPVTKVIYSHDHFDHSRGGQIFKEEGAEFIAQEGCMELLSRDLEDRVVLPDTTWKDNLSIMQGGKQIDLSYYGPNDGTCNAVIHMPKDKVLLAVDWHLPRYVNESYRLPAHNYVGVLNTLKRVRAELNYDTVISGHAPNSSPELFEEDYRFNQALFDAVWKELQAGKKPEEFKYTVKLPEFSHWRGYEKNLPGHVERMAYSIWHGN